MDRKMFEANYKKAEAEGHDMNEALKKSEAVIAAEKEKIIEIKGKPETGKEKEISAEVKEKIKDWENFLKKHFPETQFDLSKLEIPKRTAEEEKELTRLLFSTSKLKLFKKCEESFPSVNHTSEDLDEFIAKNAGEDSFKWVRDVEAADEEHKNKSGDMAEKEGLNVETIGDRIMHEFKYYDETGDHLDKKTGTLTSSRDSVGHVLFACWRGGGFHVHCIPGSRHDHWRFRQTVSSPTKSEK